VRSFYERLMAALPDLQIEVQSATSPMMPL
jgi:hypothetical protein